MKIIDIVAQLPVHPQRGQVFSLDGQPYLLQYKQRDLHNVNGIAIHHSADEGGPWSWAQYQITPAKNGGPLWTPGGLGAPGICYHYAVMLDGRVFKLNNDSTVCWHTADHNHHLFGVVFQGNFEKIPPTLDQLQSGIWLIEQLCSYDRIRRDIQAGGANLQGHGSWSGNTTSCPGTWLATALRAALLGGAQE